MLDGAHALALPTKFGQSLEVEENEGGIVKWTSHDADGSTWFDEVLPVENIILNKTGLLEPKVATLINILHYAHLANPAVLTNSIGFSITTRLDFPKNWGLGTSSTLINNIAQWFCIDAYVLLAQSFGGSGYDIACAMHNSALLYQLQEGNPVATPVRFNPAFSTNMWFVYLNQKQNSRDAIAAYRERRSNMQQIIPRINLLTDDVLYATDMQSFATALEKHEALMAGVLGLLTIQDRLFPDFKGTIKSLGAWGGDFVMAVAEENPTDYFNEKGYTTIIPYAQMIL